ncbi:hypothetical protein GCM10009623_22850 [Nocardioides aestuarii]
MAASAALAMVAVPLGSGVAAGVPGRATVVASAALAPSPNLVDRAAAAGISWPSTPSWDVTPVDYDGDGDVDFSMSLHMRNAGELRRNNGDGTFTRVGVGAVMPRPSPEGGLVDRHSCAWSDVDRNGLPDLYCAAGRYRSNRLKDESINNELFLQTSAGSFRDVATASGVGEPCTRGRHIAVLDVNGDGWDDLFVGAQKERNASGDPCNQQSGYPYNEQSKVFVNLGDNAQGEWRGFRAGTEWNVTQPNTGNRFAITWDYNHDGRDDLLTGAYANQRPRLYRNDGGGFTEIGRSGQVPLPAVNGVELADLTGDGILDLVFADDAGFAYRAGTAAGLSGTTVRIGTPPAGGRGWRVAVGDINGDGRTDVYGLVASTGSGNPADGVFVRTAGGGWQPHEVPGAGGDSNSVAAVEVGNRAQFVVLNGGNAESENPGPVQLIAWTG